MSPKLLVLLLLAPLLLAQEAPELHCDPSSQSSCYLKDLNLSPETTRYSIVYRGFTEDVITTQISGSRFPFVSNAFCETFPRLLDFAAEAQWVELLAPDAFSNCRYLSFLQLSNNGIWDLPVDVFRNARDLVYVYLQENRLSEVRPEVFRSSPGVEILSLSANDLKDLDAEGLLRLLPELTFVSFQDNLIPCSRIPLIMRQFRDRGVFVDVSYSSLRERAVPMDFVEGVRCVRA